MKLASRASVAMAGAVAVACVTWGVVASPGHRPGPLFLVLLAAAPMATLAEARARGPLAISGAFLALMLAVAFLGPVRTLAVAAVAEGAAFARRPRPAVKLAVNLVGTAAPYVAGAAVIDALTPHAQRPVAFYLLLAGVACVGLFLNYTLVSVLGGLAGLGPRGRVWSPRSQADQLPGIAISVALTVAAASIYAAVGIGGAAFALAGVLAFNYMAHLVERARERTRQYAALSWGVLAGLLRTLDARDPRASRHSAATATFARDIAAAVGMTPRDCELAHTAGLLHDIGRFALSDRVLERGRALTDPDWVAIRRHPELGAEMLSELGVYGPVARIVRAHHERLDGRGYPDQLAGDEIPELARIVAVAEVYDTLTADDTYRTPVSSFEALTELRRVSGTQLDAVYVEALAGLLAGRDVGYRHADDADFDRELDIERRLTDAAGG